MPDSLFSPKNLIKLLHGRLYRLALPLIVRPPAERVDGQVESAARAAIIRFLRSWQGRISGEVLDIGVGTWTYPRRLLQDRCRYIATDCFAHPNVDVVGDIHALSEAWDAGSFDWVLCFDVLEHTARPWDAVRQVYTVLKPGGTLLLTTPFNYRLHGNSQVIDLWRFTADGLRSLLVEEAGFSQVEITPNGHPDFPFSYAVVARKAV